MNDTTPAVEEMYRRMVMARSGEWRLRQGCELFDVAKAFAMASFADEDPARVRELLFLRFYASDFSLEKSARILEAFRARRR